MLKFRTGVEVPQGTVGAVGITTVGNDLTVGTFQLSGEACTNSVRDAIELGYRHIDTAVGYQNHREVAEGIRQSGISRKDLFVTTKIPIGPQDHAEVLQCGDQKIRELETDYLDLLLIHWPNKEIPFSETLGAMGELVSNGVVRSIGISNFNPRIMAEADEVSSVPVVTNQVEFHPFLYQRVLLNACNERTILLTAYSPIARGEVLSDARMKQIAKRNIATEAQVALAWAMEKGIIVIPKATNREHIRDNLLANRLSLSADDVADIDAFGDHKRLIDGTWKHYPLD